MLFRHEDTAIRSISYPTILWESPILIRNTKTTYSKIQSRIDRNVIIVNG